MKITENRSELQLKKRDKWSSHLSPSQSAPGQMINIWALGNWRFYEFPTLPASSG